MDFISYLNKYWKNKIVKELKKVIRNPIRYKLNIINVYIEDLANLNFKAFIIAEVDNNSKRYTITCTGNLENIKNRIQILKIEEFKYIQLDYYLNNYFLPVLNKSQLEIVADNFIKEYYPSVYNGEYIKIEKLLKNMNLRLKYRKLSLDGAFFGMICFNDTNIVYYDSNIKKVEEAQAGTIYIDSESTEKFSGVYTDNFSIVHECVHWYLHRKFFVFEKEISNGNGNSFFVATDKYLSTQINWMEYQANEIASRIILPKNIIIGDVLNIVNNYNSNNPDVYYIENSIKRISKNAKVSIEAVKIRLLKLGLRINGIYEYIDDKYINSYIFKRKLNLGESYSISLNDYFCLFRHNKKFKNIILSNKYVFVDNHICIKNRKYIKIKNNKFHLTRYALNHIDECCILFLYTIKKEFNYAYNNGYILCKSPSKKQKSIIKGFETIEEIKITPEKFSKYYNRIYQLLDSVPYNFRKRLRYYRECIGLTREQLEEKSYISAQTIKEIETNNKRGYSVETIISLCIGMQLPPEFSFELIRMSGYNIENNLTKENCIYCFILRNLYNMSIDDINEFLKSNKVNELTKVKL